MLKKSIYILRAQSSNSNRHPACCSDLSSIIYFLNNVIMKSINMKRKKVIT